MTAKRIYRRTTIICPGTAFKKCGKEIPPDVRSYSISINHLMRHICKECFDAHKAYYANPANRRQSTT